MTYHPLIQKNFTRGQCSHALCTVIGKSMGVFLPLILLLSLILPTQKSFGQEIDYLSQANDAFLEQKYDTALLYYRQHLRAYPKDATSWNLVAATHYHLGQPRRALQFLKRFQTQSEPRSHNLFYQGLAYDAIGQTAVALRYLAKASRYRDPFGALASFELVAILAAARETQAALQWAEHYQKHFPDGPQKAEVTEIKNQLRQGEAVNITESQRYQYQLGLFRHHPWSLINKPHFWLFQLGYHYAQGSRTNPAIDNNRRPIVDENAPFEDTALRIRAAFGLGPYQNKETQITLAYYYLQDWTTTRDRLETYLDEPLDFSYFPLRPDLQLRTHRLLADFHSQVQSRWSLGIYSHIEFVRSGSSLYPAPERPEIRKSLNVSYSTKFTPWVAWQMANNQQFQLYIPLEKTIDQEQSDFSRQNYRIFDSNDPFLSLALAHEGVLLNDQLSVRTDLYRFRYQFNDYWEDHVRTGFFSKANFRLNPRWSLMARLGLYVDDYNFPQIKTNSCDFQTQIGQLTDSGVNCTRVDHGQLFQGAIIYQPKPHLTWMASSHYLSHENPKLKVYNETRVEFLISFTIGFPGLKDTLGVMNRFTETSLSYEGL